MYTWRCKKYRLFHKTKSTERTENSQQLLFRRVFIECFVEWLPNLLFTCGLKRLLTGLIAYIIFYKICKFGNLPMRNDVIMTSLPKNNGKIRTSAKPNKLYIIRKVLMRAMQKCTFLLNLSHYVKRYGHFCQILAFFYDAPSSNMVMPHDPRNKFRKIFILS